MLITEKWKWKGCVVTGRWFEGDKLKNLHPITQVYGICFTPDGKVLVIRSNEEWTLPGGHPKKGETPEDTLIREVQEEASVELCKWKMIGYCRVEFPQNPDRSEGDVFYQLRYVALISRIRNLLPDPATGKKVERKFIDPKEFNKYIKWGKIGRRMFKVACEVFEKWKKEGKLLDRKKRNES